MACITESNNQLGNLLRSGGVNPSYERSHISCVIDRDKRRSRVRVDDGDSSGIFRRTMHKDVYVYESWNGNIYHNTDLPMSRTEPSGPSVNIVYILYNWSILTSCLATPSTHRFQPTVSTNGHKQNPNDNPSQTPTPNAKGFMIMSPNQLYLVAIPSVDAEAHGWSWSWNSIFGTTTAIYST